MWPGGHQSPVLEHAAEPALVADEQLVMRSRSKAREPREPLISQVWWFAWPVARREASSVPIAPDSNSTVATNASSTSRPGTKLRTTAPTLAISPTR